MAKRKILMEGDVQILPFTHVDCIVGDGKNLNELLAEKANAADLAGYVTTGMLASQLGSYVTTDNFDNVKEALMAEDARIEREYKAADAALQTAISEKVSQSTYDEKMQAVDKAIADEVERSTEKDEAMEGAISGLETNLGEIQPVVERLDGAVETEGSVKFQIAAAEKTLNEKISQADTKIAGALEIIDEKLQMEGAAASETALKAVEDAVAGLETKIEEEVKVGLANADAAAKAAQDDVDALEEIVGDASKGLVKEVNALKAKDQELQGAIDAKVAQADYNAKVAELVAEDERIAGLVATEKSRAEGAESALSTRVQANADAIAAINKNEAGGILFEAKKYADEKDTAVRGEFAAADANLQKDIDAVEKAIEDLNNADTGALAQAKSYADGIKQALQDEIDADVKVVADRVTPLETFVNNHDHKPMEDRLDALEELHKQGGVVDNKIAAVQGEVDAVEGRMDVVEGAIATINNAETGILKQAKDYADAREAAAKEYADAIENGLEPRIADVEDFVAAQPAIDQAQNDRLVALEQIAGIGGEGSDKNAFDEIREDVQAAQTAADNAQDAADAAQGEVDALEGVVNALDQAYKAADTTLQGNIDAVDDKVDALDGELAKEVEDREKAINDLRTELQGEIDADVKVEKERAEGAEATLAGRLDKLEGTGEGSVKAAADKALADAKSYADGKAATVQGNLDNLEDRVEANEGKFAGLAKDTVQAAINDAKTVVEGQVTAEANARQQADSALDLRIKAFEAGGANDAAAIKGRVDDAEGRLNVLEGEATVEGSVKYEVAQGIAEVIADAPENFDTLKEIADWIAADPTRAAALQAEITKNTNAIAAINNEETGILVTAKKYADEKDAALKTALQSEIDADVKAEADRAKAEEADIRADFAAADTALHTTISAEIDADVKAEADRAKAEEADIRADFAAADATLKSELQSEIDADVKAEADRAKGVEAAIRGEFAAADATLKSDLQAEIDADVKVVADALADEKNADKAGSLAHQIANINTAISSLLWADEIVGDKEYDDIEL